MCPNSYKERKRKPLTPPEKVLQVIDDIELANSVPVSYDFVHLSFYSWNALKDWGQSPEQYLTERRRLAMKEIIAVLPRKHFPQFHACRVFDGAHGDPDEFFARCEALKELRQFLRAVCEATGGEVRWQMTQYFQTPSRRRWCLRPALPGMVGQLRRS